MNYSNIWLKALTFTDTQGRINNFVDLILQKMLFFMEKVFMIWERSAKIMQNNLFENKELYNIKACSRNP